MRVTGTAALAGDRRGARLALAAPATGRCDALGNRPSRGFDWRFCTTYSASRTTDATRSRARRSRRPALTPTNE
jgi:hypothetical protein